MHAARTSSTTTTASDPLRATTAIRLLTAFPEDQHEDHKEYDERDKAAKAAHGFSDLWPFFHELKNLGGVLQNLVEIVCHLLVSKGSPCPCR